MNHPRGFGACASCSFGMYKNIAIATIVVIIVILIALSAAKRLETYLPVRPAGQLTLYTPKIDDEWKKFSTYADLHMPHIKLSARTAKATYLILHNQQGKDVVYTVPYVMEDLIRLVNNHL